MINNLVNPCAWWPLANSTVTSTLSRPTVGRWDSEGEDWPSALICRG